jgi:predicted lipid-binding transport protein (Tim44 family)
VEREESFLGGLGRRLLAWAVLLVALIVALKLVGAIVFGFLQMVVTIVLVISVAIAVIWAVRRI